MRTNTVKAALRDGQAQIGTWLSLASPLAARFMTRSGFHWLTLDMEHTPVDWSVAAQIFGSVAEAGGIPLARIPFNSLENVKRVLDAGAYGIVFPMCNTVEEAERAVAACKYPPLGERSIGGALHTLNFNCSAPEYFSRANDEILVIVQAEHIDAVENCEQIFAVPGLDGMFVGPNDLLSSMHKTPNMDSQDPDFIDALVHLRTTANRFGIAPGIHVSNPQAAQKRIEEGWRFLAISSELGFMLEAARNASQAVIGDAAVQTGTPRY